MEKKVIGLSELVRIAAKDAGITNEQAKAYTGALKAAIVREIKSGHDVQITGLVTFYHHHAAEREVNLHGETQIVPEHEVVKARASKKLYK